MASIENRISQMEKLENYLKKMSKIIKRFRNYEKPTSPSKQNEGTINVTQTELQSVDVVIPHGETITVDVEKEVEKPLEDITIKDVLESADVPLLYLGKAYRNLTGVKMDFSVPSNVYNPESAAYTTHLMNVQLEDRDSENPDFLIHDSIRGENSLLVVDKTKDQMVDLMCSSAYMNSNYDFAADLFEEFLRINGITDVRVNDMDHPSFWTGKFAGLQFTRSQASQAYKSASDSSASAIQNNENILNRIANDTAVNGVNYQNCIGLILEVEYICNRTYGNSFNKPFSIFGISTLTESKNEYYKGGIHGRYAALKTYSSLNVINATLAGREGGEGIYLAGIYFENGIEQIQIIGCNLYKERGYCKVNLMHVQFGQGIKFIGRSAIQSQFPDGNVESANCINDVLIYGNTCIGKYFIETSDGMVVNRSFRIIGNKSIDCEGLNMVFGSQSNTTLMLNSYFSCPIWIVDNIFEGQPRIMKNREHAALYYGAMLFKVSYTAYILRNRISNYVSSKNYVYSGAYSQKASATASYGTDGYRSDSGFGYNECPATYDVYATMKQIYYVNNKIHNLISMSLYDYDFGAFKGKGTQLSNSYHGTPYNTLPLAGYANQHGFYNLKGHAGVVRYYSSNTYTCDYNQIQQWWNTRKQDEYEQVQRCRASTGSLKNLFVASDYDFSVEDDIENFISANYQDVIHLDTQADMVRGSDTNFPYKFPYSEFVVKDNVFDIPQINVGGATDSADAIFTRKLDISGNYLNFRRGCSYISGTFTNVNGSNQADYGYDNRILYNSRNAIFYITDDGSFTTTVDDVTTQTPRVMLMNCAHLKINSSKTWGYVGNRDEGYKNANHTIAQCYGLSAGDKVIIYGKFTKIQNNVIDYETSSRTYTRTLTTYMSMNKESYLYYLNGRTYLNDLEPNSYDPSTDTIGTAPHNGTATSPYTVSELIAYLDSYIDSTHTETDMIYVQGNITEVVKAFGIGGSPASYNDFFFNITAVRYYTDEEGDDLLPFQATIQNNVIQMNYPFPNNNVARFNFIRNKFYAGDNSSYLWESDSSATNSVGIINVKGGMFHNLVCTNNVFKTNRGVNSKGVNIRLNNVKSVTGYSDSWEQSNWDLHPSGQDDFLRTFYVSGGLFAGYADPDDNNIESFIKQSIS